MMTRLKSHTLPLLILFFVMLYMSIGFAYTGIIVLPNLEPFTFGIFVLGAIFAGVQHLRGRWRYYRSPFTAMAALWVLAIGISYVANPHVWRVSLEAIWYIGLFIGMMAFFTGALTNRAFSRQTVEEAFLLVGVVLVAVGYAQWVAVVSQGHDPRLISSLIGSPNYYAMLLIILAMLALHRVITSRFLVVKLGMGLYVLAVIGQLWLTDSRGGQLGLFTAVCVYVGLWFIIPSTPDTLSPYVRLDTALQQRIGISLIRIIVFVGLMATVAVTAIIIILVGRGFLGPREELYSISIDLFLQKPLTGQGLYSFGESSMGLLSKPHYDISAHAHSVVFNTLAELGLLGMVALGYSIIAGIRIIIANRRALPRPELRGYDALVALLVGLSVHQLLDLALFYMSLLIFIIITLVITPVAPQPITKPTTRHGLTLALSLLFVGLMIGAILHMPIVARHGIVLKELGQQQAAGEVDYPEMIQQFQALIDLDPQNRSYHLQLATLAGEYAHQTNTANDIEAAIEAHRNALELMPHLAVGWSNLAGLYWQAGNIAAATDAATTAVRYASDWSLPRWQYWAYSTSQRLPWALKRPDWHYFSTSLTFIYMRGITDPVMLVQSTDSISMPPDLISRFALRKLLDGAAWLSQSMPPMEASQ